MMQNFAYFDTKYQQYCLHQYNLLILIESIPFNLYLNLKRNMIKQSSQSIVSFTLITYQKAIL